MSAGCTCRCPAPCWRPWPVPASRVASTASSTAGRCCGTCRTPRSSASWAPATTIPSCPSSLMPTGTSSSSAGTGSASTCSHGPAFPGSGPRRWAFAWSSSPPSDGRATATSWSTARTSKRSPPWAGTNCATARTSHGSAARKSPSWYGTGSCPTPRRQGWTLTGSFTRWPSGPGTATSRPWSPRAPTGTTAAGSATPRRKPTSGTSSTGTCCSGHGTTEARASAPASSRTTSTATAPTARSPCARARGTPAGTTAPASPSGSARRPSSRP